MHNIYDIKCRFIYCYYYYYYLYFQVPNEIQVTVLTWFHIVWARDILLIVAWLIISMTKFSDFLCGHLNNMKKYAQINNSDNEKN